MSPDDPGLLDDMLSSARAALRYVEGMAEADFIRDEKTVDAVVRRLEVIGEAAGRVSVETKARLSEGDSVKTTRVSVSVVA